MKKSLIIMVVLICMVFCFLGSRENKSSEMAKTEVKVVGRVTYVGGNPEAEEIESFERERPMKTLESLIIVIEVQYKNMNWQKNQYFSLNMNEFERSI